MAVIDHNVEKLMSAKRGLARNRLRTASTAEIWSSRSFKIDLSIAVNGSFPIQSNPFILRFYRDIGKFYFVILTYCSFRRSMLILK
ncbi:hypothetical protein LCO01nite_03690 [Lapidilactobacillus concavus]|nr:hypothetical protein LCO01nite_03690 [Lapidilactobacillus concavus]